MAKTPAVGKKAAKTPKKAGKSTKRTKRVESYRCVEKLARSGKVWLALSRVEPPPTYDCSGRQLESIARVRGWSSCGGWSASIPILGAWTPVGDPF